MQRKYIEDFSELERMLVLDMNFLRCACNGYEDRDLLICIIRIMYRFTLHFNTGKTGPYKMSVTMWTQWFSI